jgi:hypothetical protein
MTTTSLIFKFERDMKRHFRNPPETCEDWCFVVITWVVMNVDIPCRIDLGGVYDYFSSVWKIETAMSSFKRTFKRVFAENADACRHISFYLRRFARFEHQFVLLIHETDRKVVMSVRKESIIKFWKDYDDRIEKLRTDIIKLKSNPDDDNNDE